MGRSLVPLAIFIATVGTAVITWRTFAGTEKGRIARTLAVSQSRSELHAGLVVVHARGPVARETYEVDNLNGRSSARYRVEGRGGSAVTVAIPPTETYLVTFFFEKLVADGVWELTSKPPRGDTDDSYAVHVAQLVNGASGSHAFSFTDPRYWATTGGHQFRIRLERDKPVPDLLRMSGTVLIEPRYGRLVADFRDFGTDRFRAAEQSARARMAAAR